MSEEDLSSLFCNLSVGNQSDNSIENICTSNTMNAEQLHAIIQASVAAALANQQEVFNAQVAGLQSDLNQLKVDRDAPNVVQYSDAVINRSIGCDLGLDVVKSLPDFTGDPLDYLTFRKAAENAYKLYSPFDGSVKHFEALAIIRNKIKGKASSHLTGFETAFNFKAIISRLDEEYGDKKPLHLLEQEMSILRQGNNSIYEFYDAVQLKLAAVTNKCLMMYDKDFASPLNDKYRRDALRVFVSGLKKNLSELLFSCKPADLPTALAMAEEAESNRERYQFAMGYSRPIANVEVKGFTPPPNVNPRYVSGHARPQIQSHPQNPTQPQNRTGPQVQPQSGGSYQQAPVPMDVDQSMRSRFRNESGQWKRQQVNATFDATHHSAYDEIAEENLQDIVEGDSLCNYVHFLESGPLYHSSKD